MTESALLDIAPDVADGSELAVSERSAATLNAAEDILARVLCRVTQTEYPQATYRLQFGRAFGFRAAADIVPYLKELGISHCYASPYLKANAGSSHGYDVVDHSLLNPELGTEADFAAFVDELRNHGMGHILDIVPNHMGVGTDANAWWQDVLENGPASAYSDFFDINWSPLKPDLNHKVLLPVLGDQFGRILENQELKLEFVQGAFGLRYYDRWFPLAPRSYALVLRYRLDELEQHLGNESSYLLEYQSILTAIGHLPPPEDQDAERRAEGLREKEIIKRRLQRLCEESSTVANFVRDNVQAFNGQRGEPHSFDRLDELLQQQSYRLAYWRVASDEINYRRFFDVNELAAVCMERPEVFAQAHALPLRLIAEGRLDGLRIDHADGLYDPSAYLRNLQEERFLQMCRHEFGSLTDSITLFDHSSSIGWSELEPQLRRLFHITLAQNPATPLVRPLYVVVEKILEGNERMPESWPVHGTTGYDFLNEVNALFVHPQTARIFDSIYARFIADKTDFEDLMYQSKRLIMKVAMTSELNVLGHYLDRLSECNRWSRDFTLHGLTLALREIVACFPVYRTYISGDSPRDRDRTYVEQAVARARRRNPAVSQAVFDFIQDVLLMRGLERSTPAELAIRHQFIGRFQQFTGPMMAKAVEDTACYRYHRLISLNEVGGDPRRFGASVSAFHQQNIGRQSRLPYALLATSTHDTKRSEDVRARINVLSEIPTEWKSRVFRWTRWNKRKKVKVDGELAPCRNDEYLLYQSLVGAWPLASQSGAADPTFVARIQQFMTKAIREAKVFTSWITPHDGYERALHDFIEAILCADPASAFRVDCEPFVAQVARVGLWNSLSQTLLKLTSPGVPDLYQGTELWDFSLVDPDNRRPVDFALRRRVFGELREQLRAALHDRRDLLRQMVHNVDDGRIKMFVIQETLRRRRAHPHLFTTGAYVPLEVSGTRAEHVCAFARVTDEVCAIVAAPRLIASIAADLGAPPVGIDVWQDTTLHLPPQIAAAMWYDVFGGRPIAVEESAKILFADWLADFPVGLAMTEPVVPGAT